MAESYNICLDVGGTKVLGAIFNEKDEIIYRLKKRSKSGGTGSADVELNDEIGFDRTDLKSDWNPVKRKVAETFRFTSLPDGGGIVSLRSSADTAHGTTAVGTRHSESSKPSSKDSGASSR